METAATAGPTHVEGLRLTSPKEWGFRLPDLGKESPPRPNYGMDPTSSNYQEDEGTMSACSEGSP